MAKTTNLVVEEVTETTEEIMNENTKKTTKKSIDKAPLEDSDEIVVVSLIPRVSYKDSKTLDMYEWDEVGHKEYMTFETLKNMWRNNKTYFKNMWLKPEDERVIDKFGLSKTFEKYDFLMDETNYTKDKIPAICKAISDMPNGLKIAMCDKIKNMVVTEKITNASVMKALEEKLKIDLY